MGAQRELKANLARLEATQRRALDPQRLQSALRRISNDAESARELLERGRRAFSTIGAAARYCALAVRLVKLLN